MKRPTCARRWIEDQVARQLEVNADERTRYYEGHSQYFSFPSLLRCAPAMQAGDAGGPEICELLHCLAAGLTSV